MKLNLLWNRFNSWWERQAYHFVFVFSLLILILLVTWWGIFLYRSVNENYETKRESILQSAHSYSLYVGHNSASEPVPGRFALDPRLEIIKSEIQPGSNALHLHPVWNQYWLQPRTAILNQMQYDLKKKHFMIIGESALLVLVILVSGFMVYRIYWLEKRTTQELHELWSRVSHEIKTPITGVKAFLETLEAQELSREEMAPLLKLALKQVERQQQLTENMLVGQKLKRDGAGVNVTDLEMRHFIQRYVAKHPRFLAGEALSFSGDGTNDISFPVLADPEALRIIFDNLVDNAVKYGGADVSIDIRIEQRKKWVDVIFEDNGPGFQPEMAKKIFEAYSRLGNELPGGQHGTGMGLYISRRLATRMEGNLSARSEGKGKGATFMLSLKILRTNKTKNLKRKKPVQN